MIRVGLGSLMVLVLALWGCEARVDQNVLAKVNEAPITMVDLERSLVSYGLAGETVQEVLISVLDDLINQALILQQAGKIGITVSPEELAQAEKEILEDYPGDSFEEMLLTQALDHQEWRRELKNRLLVKKTVASQIEARLRIDPTDVDRALAEQENLGNGDRIKVAQIMTQDKAQAQKSHKELKSGIPFERVADKYSILADQAGQETGYFGKGEMPPELEKAVWSLKVGQLSKVVKSEYGWHVFLVLDRRRGGQVDRKQVEARVELSRKAELEATWLLELRNTAEITINSARLAELAAALSRRHVK